jgi:hypothetical protein
MIINRIYRAETCQSMRLESANGASKPFTNEKGFQQSAFSRQLTHHSLEKGPGIRLSGVRTSRWYESGLSEYAILNGGEESGRKQDKGWKTCDQMLRLGSAWREGFSFVGGVGGNQHGGCPTEQCEREPLTAHPLACHRDGRHVRGDAPDFLNICLAQKSQADVLSKS